MAGKFCVSITHSHQDPDKATVGFVVANAALAAEKETLVFLSTDGVWLAVPGEAEKISLGAPFAPLTDLINKYVAAGGRLIVCNPCLLLRTKSDRFPQS